MMQWQARAHQACTTKSSMAEKRDIRALRDIEQANQINETSWSVQSSNNDEPYVVDHLDDGWQCGCDDHQFRGVLCKHIRRVQMEIGERCKPMITLDDFVGGLDG